MVKLLICAGGTGGGVYPALTVLQTLSTKSAQFLWVGSQGGMEAALVERENIRYESIPAAGVHGVGLRSLPGNLISLFKGTLKARRILKEFQPDAILYTGGYVAAPMAVAGRSVPSILYVPDIEPGLALNFLARFAKAIALTTETSKSYFDTSKTLKVTGYPTRPALGDWTHQEAKEKLGLQSDLPVLLFMGGSQGARSINQALRPALPQLLKKAQVIHISGPKNWEEVSAYKNGLEAELAERYHPYDYLHEQMGAALASADLVISRAGASILGEYPIFGLPAILVPYPYAWRYQKVNADFLAERQAAVVLKDEDLQEKLLPMLLDILEHPERLQEMKINMKNLARPNAARDIAGLILEISGKALPKGEAQ